MYKRLKIKGFIDPRLLNSARSDDLIGVVKSNWVQTEFGVLEFVKVPPPYPEGTQVHVLLGYTWSRQSFFHCVSVRERQLAEIRNAAEVSLQESEQKMAQRRDDIIKREVIKTQLESFNLPFAWGSARKLVLSGLVENSNGEGTNKRSVVHIALEKDFKKGKLIRQKGEFLCTKINGDFESTPITFNLDDEELPEEITCKACLKRAKTLSQSQ